MVLLEATVGKSEIGLKRDPELFIPEQKDFSNYINPEDAAKTYYSIVRVIREAITNQGDSLFLAAYNAEVVLKKADKKISANNKILTQQINQFGNVYAKRSGQGT